MNMAATLFRLTPEEALAGLTRNGARALGLQDRLGTLEIGKVADVALWDIERPAELVYWIARNPLHAVLRAGRPQEIRR
jgi:imidazolonepropionase